MWKHSIQSNLIATLMGALTLVACDRARQPDLALDDQLSSAPSTAEPQASEAASGVASAAAPSTFEPGVGRASPASAEAAPVSAQVLDYVPNDCPVLRAYVDVQRLTKFDTIGAGLGTLAERAFARTGVDEKYLSPVLGKLDASGLRLNRDVREVATCMVSRSDWSTLVAVDPNAIDGDASKVLKQAAKAAGVEDAVLERRGGVTYVALKPGHHALGFVAPGVLAYASKPEILAEAAAKPGDPTAFAGLSSNLAGLRFRAGQQSGTFLLRSRDGEFQAELRVNLPTRQLDAIRKDPRAYAAKLKGLIETGLGREIDAKLPSAKRVKQALGNLDQLEVSVSDNQVVARLSVSKELVREAALGAPTVDPEVLERVFR